MRQTSRREMAMFVALTAVLAAFGSRVEGQNVQILPLNSAEDLDLSGNIIYAINFGNNGCPKFGDFVFSQDQDYPQLAFTFSEEGQTSTWQGLPPNTGDPDLDMLLHGVIWSHVGPRNSTTAIRAPGLVVGARYQIQLIFYADQRRPIDIVIQGDTILESHDIYVAQGGVQGKGGSIVKYRFHAGYSILDISLTAYGLDSVISGFVLTELQEPTFSDYGSGTTIELVSGKGTWQINWGQGRMALP